MDKQPRVLHHARGRLTLAVFSALAAGCALDVPPSQPVAVSSQALTDTSSPAGRWFLRANGWRLELNVSASGSGFTGTIKDEGGSNESLSNISWDAAGRWLEFRRNGPGFFQWYRLSLVEGVMAGRFSHSAASAKPALTAFASHVTGWSPNYLDSGSVPRVWDVTINAAYQGVLRIDKDSGGTLRGRLKIYDNSQVEPPTGQCETPQEELEYQLTSISWNGTNLSFVRSDAGFTQQFSGTASGRFINGTFSHNGSGAFPWSGARSQVLGFGLGSRLPQRATWQAQTRSRLVNLTEGMRIANSGIPAVTVVEEACTGCPFTGGNFPPERDDNPNGWAANYTLKRLKFTVSPGNRFDPASPPPARVFRGYLATPNGAPPPGGYRAVVAVNGHGGSAQAMMTKSSDAFWHGESAARRYLVVLALDIGHRPAWNEGPIVHSAIVGAGYGDSDWEEDGERAFSVRRAVDYLAALPNVRADRIFIEGLSMGGEVTTITAALDPRMAMAIASGYSPDMHVMDNYCNHPCYLWNNASIHEYMDISDYEALIAPRPLVVETGMQDKTFSGISTPWASDKQAIARARAAYGADVGKLIHYLHYDFHRFHIGDFNPTNPSRPQGVLATSVPQPTSPTDLGWQTNFTTFVRSPTLYHLMNEFFPP